VLCTKGLKDIKSGKLISTIGVSRKSIVDRGMTIDLSGRLNGVRRARGMVEQEGGVSGNTLCKKYKYSVNNITTK
jgi:ribosomal protein S3